MHCSSGRGIAAKALTKTKARTFQRDAKAEPPREQLVALLDRSNRNTVALKYCLDELEHAAPKPYGLTRLQPATLSLRNRAFLKQRTGQGSG